VYVIFRPTLKTNSSSMASTHSTAQHLRDIARMMWRFRVEGFLCDTVLYADDGQQARAHSIVLAAASPVFRDALRVNGESTPRSEPHMIQLPGCDLATLELALHIIYTGSVEDDEGIGASADDLQRVFLLLQQLGVELDRIEGCSITYVERH
jgi:hypothetical protein